MMENDIREQVMLLIKDKLQRLAIKESELDGNFDLVKSGLLNSLEFVDLVASLEKMRQVEIDFEVALDKGDLTTVAGLTRAINERE